MKSKARRTLRKATKPSEETRVLVEEAIQAARKATAKRGGLRVGDMVIHPPTDDVVHELISTKGDIGTVRVAPRRRKTHGKTKRFPLNELVDAREVNRQFHVLLDKEISDTA